jgi:hypothetical protein
MVILLRNFEPYGISSINIYVNTLDFPAILEGEISSKLVINWKTKTVKLQYKHLRQKLIVWNNRDRYIMTSDKQSI